MAALLEEPEPEFAGPPLTSENLHSSYLRLRQKGVRAMVLIVAANLEADARRLVDEADLRAIAGVAVDETFMRGAWDFEERVSQTVRGSTVMVGAPPSQEMT